MLLDDEAPCPGHLLIVTNRHAGICINCERFCAGTRNHIEPAAVRGPRGVWDCENRRVSGHTLSVADELLAAHPAD